jgi:hypothetical protein
MGLWFPSSRRRVEGIATFYGKSFTARLSERNQQLLRTSAEVVLRMMVYREFTRIGGGKVPDDKSMGRLARQLGPEVVEHLNQRMLQIAREAR